MQLAASLLQSKAIVRAPNAQGTWQCPVCFEEKPGSRCVRLDDCRHVFCAECVATHAGLHVSEGSLDKLRCLDPGCKERLSRQVFVPNTAKILQRFAAEPQFPMPDSKPCARYLDRGCKERLSRQVFVKTATDHSDTTIDA